jgi:hypothetical protein
VHEEPVERQQRAAEVGRLSTPASAALGDVLVRRELLLQELAAVAELLLL